MTVDIGGEVRVRFAAVPHGCWRLDWCQRMELAIGRARLRQRRLWMRRHGVVYRDPTTWPLTGEALESAV
jgi:hypothetical protein